MKINWEAVGKFLTYVLVVGTIWALIAVNFLNEDSRIFWTIWVSIAAGVYGANKWFGKYE